MRIYYISKVSEDTCELVTPNGCYKEVVALDELHEFSKSCMVVGYNKLTGKISVQTEEDAINYMESKAKLSGTKHFGIPPKVSIIEAKTELVEDENLINLYITDSNIPEFYGYDLDCLVDAVRVCWYDIVENFVETFFNEWYALEDETETAKMLNNLKYNIIIDLKPYKRFYIDSPNTGYELHLNSFKVKSKDMFKNAVRIENLFETGFIISPETVIDLSELVFPKEPIVDELFGFNPISKSYNNTVNGKECNLLLHHSFYKANHVQLFSTYVDSSINETMFTEIMHKFSNSCTLFERCGVQRLNLSDLKEFCRKRWIAVSEFKVDTLVLDSQLDSVLKALTTNRGIFINDNVVIEKGFSLDNINPQDLQLVADCFDILTSKSENDLRYEFIVNRPITDILETDFNNLTDDEISKVMYLKDIVNHQNTTLTSLYICFSSFKGTRSFRETLTIYCNLGSITERLKAKLVALYMYKGIGDRIIYFRSIDELNSER